MAFQQQQDEEPDYRQVLHPSGRTVLVPIEKVIHSQQLYVHDAKTTCRYASKRCSNPRTTKRNGELHSFCEWHRTKANQNQRRLESKKKLQRVGIGSSNNDNTPSSTASSPVPSMELSITTSNSTIQDFESSSKLGSPHISHHSYDDDGGDDDSEEDPVARYSPSPFDPIGVHDPQAWAASNQYYYLPPHQHHHHSQLMDHLDNHSVTNSYNTGYQPSPPPPHARAAYSQFQPLGNPLMEWELTGDLVGSSVAFAQTLNL